MTPEQAMIAELQQKVKVLETICNDLLTRVMDIEDRQAEAE